MKSTSVMLPVVFEEFEVAYIFLLLLFFLLSLSIYIRPTLAKIWGGGWGGGAAVPPVPRPASTGLVLAKMLHHPCLTLP